MLKTRVADEGEMSPIFFRISDGFRERADFRNCERDRDATNCEVRTSIVAFQ